MTRLSLYLLSGYDPRRFVREHILIAALAFNAACVGVIVGLAVALWVTQ